MGRAVETEPNLDRRVAILDEACKRYPTEGQFCGKSSDGAELRDLVGINRDVSQLRGTRTVHRSHRSVEHALEHSPAVSGHRFQISQLERRREHQTEEDKKSRLIQRIDRAC